jgi:hypothetical protein
VKINNRHVCRRLVDVARGDETPSQVVGRLLDEREALLDEVRTLKRQARYHVDRCRDLELRLAQEEKPRHLNEAQHAAILRARDRYYGR